MLITLCFVIPSLLKLRFSEVFSVIFARSAQGCSRRVLGLKMMMNVAAEIFHFSFWKLNFMLMRLLLL